jgi:S1-C subfamily serine protease
MRNLEISEHTTASAKTLSLHRWSIASVLGCLAIGAFFALPTPAAAQDMNPETAERAKHATVLVFTAASKSQKGDEKLGSGSGFFINSTGMAITNNHVVDPAHGKNIQEKQEFHYRTGKLTWSVVTDSGIDAKEKTWECDVIYQNDAADQAILQCYNEKREKLRTPNYLHLLPESRLRTRMKVWAFGFPGGDTQKTSRDKHPAVTISDGFVTELPRTPAGRVRAIVTDVLARPGNSGGPMVDIDGFVVGTVTLMGQIEGRANTAALVPAELSGEFVRNAFQLKRIPEGTDVAPFVSILADENGRLNIPGFERLPDRDVLFFKDGDRVYGTIATDKITWNSPLGTVEVPTEAIAYVMSGDEGSNLFLEGGNRISASEAAPKFQFTPEGGTQIEQSLEDVGVVAFRTKERRVEPVTGTVTALVSDAGYLVLSDVEGKGKFESRTGAIDVGLEEIARVETGGDEDKQILNLRDGRRLTGRFQKVPFRAKLASTQTPIQFDLSGVAWATVEMLQRDKISIGGLDLPGVLASADRDIRRVAEALDAGDHAGARTQIDRMLEPEEFKKLPEVVKEQVYLLDGVAAIRAGDFATANKSLRRAVKAADRNVAAYAAACAAVLKRYENGYEGKPVSEPTVFVQAGSALADESIRAARELLKDQETLTGKKGEYAKTIGAVKKHEEALLAAAVFVGTVADDERIRLWKLATQVCEQEILRLSEQLGERPTPTERGGKRGAPAAPRSSPGTAQMKPIAQWERDKLQKERDAVMQTLEEYRGKLGAYGFRIEDPDIHKFREQQGEDEEP